MKELKVDKTKNIGEPVDETIDKITERPKLNPVPPKPGKGIIDDPVPPKKVTPLTKIKK